MLAFLFELCDVTAMLLHFHRSKIEHLFSDGQLFFRVDHGECNLRQRVWFTVDVALPSEVVMTTFNDRLS